MVPIAVLGVVTIIGYAACYDAYGVLIGPISADTSWLRVRCLARRLAASS